MISAKKKSSPAAAAEAADMRAANFARASMRLKAWWNGESIAPDAIEAAIRKRLAERAMIRAAGAQVEVPARVKALQLVWGEGRISVAPPQEAEQDLAALVLPPKSNIALIGGGVSEPAMELIKNNDFSVTMFEWRGACLAPARRRVAVAGLADRVNVESFDLDAGLLPDNAFDAVISRDELVFCFEKKRLVRRIHQGLKPGGVWLGHELTGAQDRLNQTAFATAWADPQLWDEEQLKPLFDERGFVLAEESDESETLRKALRAGLEKLADAVDVLARQAHAADGEPLMQLKELGWEAEATRARARALADGSLRRWRFLLRKPDPNAPVAAEAPAFSVSDEHEGEGGAAELTMPPPVIPPAAN
ncbi:MAG: class I SAM-dependent methyltransferase [Caulobacterales bacterium]